MRHLFIVNPVAGRKNAWKETVNEIERVMAECRDPYELYITEGTMDAAEKVKREAIKGDELRVYACGGDGTLSECVHGGAGYNNVSVTHYPCGTGNDFIKTFSEDLKLFYDLKSLVDGDVLPLDIIDVNGRKCIDIASVGIDARVGTEGCKYKNLPIIGNKGAYVISLIVNLFKGISSTLVVTPQNEKSIMGKFTLVCVCNGRYYGGGFNPTKTAMPNDGVLDMLIVKGVSIFTLAGLIGKYAKGEYYNYPKLIKYVGGTKMIIESEKAMTINVDGEPIYAKRAEFKLVPQGVNFIFPKNSSFYREQRGEREMVVRH